MIHQIGSAVVTLLLSLMFAFAVAAQTPREKELNTSVEQDKALFERLLGEVDRGTTTAATLSSLNAVVDFRERWWRPGGVLATAGDLSLYEAGTLREAYELRGRAKLLLKDHDGALADFASSYSKANSYERDHESRNVEDFSKYYDSLFTHIRTHRTSAERLADIDAVIGRAPGIGILYIERANYQGDYRNAVADAEKAIDLSPKASRFYDFALELYFNGRDAEGALNLLNRATTEIPLNFRFHRIRADVLRGDLETGDPNLAVQRLTKVIDECKCQRMRLYYYYRERASAYFLLKNYDAVIADATKAIDISDAMSGGKPATRQDDPDDWTQTTHPYFYRASAYMAKGMYKEALPDLDELVRVNGWGTDHEARAEARCKLGDYEGAKEDEMKAKAEISEIKNPCKPK